ncbi:MAG: hypothetical protein R6W76_23440 [Caldilinea sp.]
MKPSTAVIWLSIAIAMLGAGAGGAGLFWETARAPYTFTVLHGDAVDIYGGGIYADDSVFKSGATRGGDVTTLFLAVPILVISLWFYRRGSVRGALLLTGTLTHFLYVYATMTVGVAYNSLFLLYVAIFGCSFYAWFLMVMAIQPLATRFPSELPYRRIGVFLIACGLLTSFVWLEPIISSSLRGLPPALLGHSTTVVTEALDLATIVPACFVAGLLLFRRDRRGLTFATPVLALLFFIGPSIVAMTVFQLADGITFTVPEIVGPIGGFLVLGVINLWVLAILLRAAPEQTSAEQVQTRWAIDNLA